MRQSQPSNKQTLIQRAVLKAVLLGTLISLNACVGIGVNIPGTGTSIGLGLNGFTGQLVGGISTQLGATTISIYEP
jgi:hypothetical protein